MCDWQAVRIYLVLRSCDLMNNCLNDNTGNSNPQMIWLICSHQRRWQRAYHDCNCSYASVSGQCRACRFSYWFQVVRALNLGLSLTCTCVPRFTEFPFLTAFCQAAQYLVIFIWSLKVFKLFRQIHPGWSCSFRLFLRSVHQIDSKLHTLVYHRVDELVITFDFCPVFREPFWTVSSHDYIGLIW